VAQGLIDETVSGADVQDAQTDFIAEISEALEIDGTSLPQTDFVATQSETVRSTGASAAGANFVATLLEQIDVSDEPVSRYLWELINDSQAVVWQKFNTDAGGGWGLVDSEQPSDWQEINTV
jgi:hypothetical protein